MTSPATADPAKAPTGPSRGAGSGLLHRLDPARLLPVAWPVYFELMSGVIAGIISVFWVARLGSAELSAVTMVTSLENVLLGVILAIGGGTTVALSRAVGAEDHSRTRQVLGTALRVTLVVTAVTCAVLLLAREPLARLTLGDTDARALDAAADYLAIAVPGIAVFYGQHVLDSVFKAHGDTRTPMRMAMLSNGILLVADPVLIFGWLGAPRLGVAGSALALVLSRAAVLLWTVRLYLRSELRARLAAQAVEAPPRPDGAEAGPTPLAEIWKSGSPMAIDFFVRMAAGLLVVGVIARFGTEDVAAYGTVTKVLLFLSMAAYAIRQAATIVAARATGAGDAGLVADTRSSTLRLGVVWSVLSGLLVLAGTSALVAVLTEDQQVRDAAASQAPWLAVYIGLLLCNVALSGVFFGGGQGSLLAYLTLGGATLQAVLAPSLAATALGLTGVWLAMIANVGLQTTVMTTLSMRALAPASK
ncbi:MATE family efflux transporter [Streptomyces hawaiiensis]|uniref:MATE family efflux transporter n=1 Tax=Streptomyces hawaiiensis TaxID=67305 RepID=UPI00365DD48C